MGSQEADGFDNGGDPVTIASFGPSYIHATSVFQGLYNRPDIYTPGNSFVDVLHASRTILWLKGGGEAMQHAGGGLGVKPTCVSCPFPVTVTQPCPTL